MAADVWTLAGSIERAARAFIKNESEASSRKQTMPGHEVLGGLLEDLNKHIVKDDTQSVEQIVFVILEHIPLADAIKFLAICCVVHGAFNTLARFADAITLDVIQYCWPHAVETLKKSRDTPAQYKKIADIALILVDKAADEKAVSDEMIVDITRYFSWGFQGWVSERTGHVFIRDV